MKKYLLHPDRIFGAIVTFVISIPIYILIILGCFADKSDLGLKEYVAFILFSCIGVFSVAYVIYYLIKHGGTITYDSEYVIIKKHFKTIKIKISDIRWIKV